MATVSLASSKLSLITAERLPELALIIRISNQKVGLAPHTLRNIIEFRKAEHSHCSASCYKCGMGTKEDSTRICAARQTRCKNCPAFVPTRSEGPIGGWIGENVGQAS